MTALAGPLEAVELGPREVTLATLMKRRGYSTFMAGKWHLNGGLEVEKHTQPQDHGFDGWLALNAWAIPHHKDPTNFFRDGRPVGEMRGYAAQIVADEAIAWLDKRPREAPFFLYLPFVEPGQRS
jgi:arylsulfatase A